MNEKRSEKFDSVKITYGNRQYGVGAIFEVWFHRSGTGFVARSDEGIVMLPTPGSRMIAEMLLGGWKIVQAKVKITSIKRTGKGTYCVFLHPLEWRGLFK